MSTRANIVIKYEDRNIGGPSELWLLHHHDGNVQGIGETVVWAVHAYGRYVENGGELQRLWDLFPPEFENATGLEQDIEFLYRVTYTHNRVTVVARHGGYVGERAEQHYRNVNDTPDNSVELYRALYEGYPAWHVASCRYEIREPKSYIRTLMQQSQPAARAWRGRLR
jgi:hypothetical protein